MRWQQVFGSGISAWLVKAVLWVAVGFAVVRLVPAQMVPGSTGHDIGVLNTTLAVVMAFIMAFADGVLMLVIGGILVAMVRRKQMTWRDGLAAGAMQALLLGGGFAGIDGFGPLGPWGLVAMGVVAAIELTGAAVGVVVWRKMQRDTDVTKAF